MDASTKDRLFIHEDIPASEQMASFQNATLQDTAEGLTFSVSVYVKVPAGSPGDRVPNAHNDADILAQYLDDVFHRALTAAPELRVEIQVGASDDE